MAKAPANKGEAEALSAEDEAKLLLEVNKKNLARKLAKGSTLRADEKALLEAQAGGDGETWANNKVALAKAMGISRPTLDKLLKRPGCPQARSNGKYYVPEIRAFYRPDFPTQGGLDESPSARKDMLICQGIAQRNDERLFDFQAKRRLFIHKDEIAETVRTANEQVKSELFRRFLQTAPAEYEGVNGEEHACREINRRHLDEAFEFLTDHFSKQMEGAADESIHRPDLQG